MLSEDTIAVISSPKDKAISVIRLSGDKHMLYLRRLLSLKLDKKILRVKKQQNYFGIIHHKDEIIDEVIISKLKNQIHLLVRTWQKYFVMVPSIFKIESWNYFQIVG